MPRMSKLADARRSRRSRLAVVLAYAAVGVGWTVVSDAIVSALPDELNEPISTFKGIIFVLLTGALLWVVMLVRDLMVERERTALIESEQRHRLIAERQHDVVYRFRVVPRPGFEYVSPSIETITGHTPEEHYADPALGRDLVHPDDLSLLASAAAGDDSPVLIRWRRKDGTFVYTEHRVTPILDDAGTLVAVDGVARDVTARIRAEEYQRRLVRAIDATPVGVAVLTRGGPRFELAYVNPALAELTGAPVADVVGRDPLEFLDLFGPVATPELRRQLLAGEPFKLETTITRPGGPPSPIGLLISPVADAEGGVDSVVAIVVDRAETMARRQAETRLGLVLNASPAPIIVTGTSGDVTEWNAAAERVFGWRADEVLGNRFPLLPDDALATFRALRDRLAGGEVPAAADLTLVHRDGRRIPCRVQAALVPADGLTGVGMVGVIEDLSGTIEQEHAQARLASAIDAAGEAILITDLDGAITYVNPAFERVSGYSRAELIGQNPRILQSGLTSNSVYADLWARLASGQVWRGVLFNRRKDGSLFEEEATLSPVFGSDGNPIAFVGVKRDLTMERTLAEGLATELNDRAAVQETMARLELGETPEETAQLLCEALANFEDVHEVLLQHLPPVNGPAVLIGVAGEMARGRQIGDTVDSGLAEAIRLRATGGAWSSQQPGVPSLPTPRGEDPEGATVVAAPVRHRGRPVAVLYLGSRTSAPDAWIARHLRIASELAAHVGPMLGPPLARRDTVVSSADDVATIIATGAFTPFFQPICDLDSGLAVGWESLTRFDDGVPPSRRFADAHATGLGPDLELACGSRAVAAFAALGHLGWLSVDLSPSVVLSGRADELMPTGRQPIVLEFTESVAAPDYSRLRGAIDRLRAPAMIAVHEAGAGYSGLRNVLELRPDFIKLDLGLVHELERDTARQALIAGMVHLASQAGAQVIAEGVETDVERRMLLRLGVRLGQGHLLGAASPSGEVVAGSAVKAGAADPGASVAGPSGTAPT